MPLALLIIGVVLAVTAFRNTYKDVGTLLVGDLTGSGNFLVWIGAIAVVGMAGYIQPLKYPSRLFLALILLVMLLSNNGFFQQFANALKSAQAQPATATPEPQLQGPLPIAISGGGSAAGGSPIGALASAATGGSNPLKSIPVIGSFLG